MTYPPYRSSSDVGPHPVQDELLKLVAAAAGSPMPMLADVAVLAIDDDAGHPSPVAGNLIVRHRNRSEEATVESLIAGSLPLLIEVARCLEHRTETSGGIWLPAVTESVLHRVAGQAGRALARLATDLELASLIVVPLQSAHGTIGALVLGRIDPEARYGTAEFAVARSLGTRMAAALDGGRLRDRLAPEDAGEVRPDSGLLKWTHAFEHAPYGAAIVDPSGRLETVNPAFARMHGYATTAELHGIRLAHLLEAGRVGRRRPRALTTAWCGRVCSSAGTARRFQPC